MRRLALTIALSGALAYARAGVVYDTPGVPPPYTDWPTDVSQLVIRHQLLGACAGWPKPSGGFYIVTMRADDPYFITRLSRLDQLWPGKTPISRTRIAAVAQSWINQAPDSSIDMACCTALGTVCTSKVKP